MLRSEYRIRSEYGFSANEERHNKNRSEITRGSNFVVHHKIGSPIHFWIDTKHIPGVYMQCSIIQVV